MRSYRTRECREKRPSKKNGEQGGGTGQLYPRVTMREKKMCSELSNIEVADDLDKKSSS